MSKRSLLSGRPSKSEAIMYVGLSWRERRGCHLNKSAPRDSEVW